MYGGFTVSAALFPLRIGGVVSAEITRTEIPVKNLGKYDYVFPFKHKAYAVVAIKLHKGRSIGIYDFKLKYKGESYKCIALRKGNGTFDAKLWEIKKTDPDTVYSLLFVVDSEVFGNAKTTLTATLLYDLKPNSRENYELPFKFINYDKLTPVDKIPGTGVYPEVKIETRKATTPMSANTANR
jgi:hypothetical protein